MIALLQSRCLVGIWTGIGGNAVELELYWFIVRSFQKWSWFKGFPWPSLRPFQVSYRDTLTEIKVLHSIWFMGQWLMFFLQNAGWSYADRVSRGAGRYRRGRRLERVWRQRWRRRRRWRLRCRRSGRWGGQCSAVRGRRPHPSSFGRRQRRVRKSCRLP